MCRPQNLSLLRELIPHHLTPYLATMQCFDKVVQSCFGQTIDASYEQHILEFKRNYLMLGKSVTLKAHSIFNHIVDWVKIVQKGSLEHGLSKFSEQAFESAHRDYLRTKANYAKNPSLTNAGERALRCLIVYNSQHI